MPWFSKEFRLKQFPLESLRKYFNMLVKKQPYIFWRKQTPLSNLYKSGDSKTLTGDGNQIRQGENTPEAFSVYVFRDSPLLRSLITDPHPPPRFELGGSWKISWSEEGDKVIMLKKSPPIPRDHRGPRVQGNLYNPPPSK